MSPGPKRICSTETYSTFTLYRENPGFKVLTLSTLSNQMACAVLFCISTAREYQSRDYSKAGSKLRCHKTGSNSEMIRTFSGRLYLANS